MSKANSRRKDPLLLFCCAGAQLSAVPLPAIGPGTRVTNSDAPGTSTPRSSLPSRARADEIAANATNTCITSHIGLKCKYVCGTIKIDVI